MLVQEENEICQVNFCKCAVYKNDENLRYARMCEEHFYLWKTFNVDES